MASLGVWDDSDEKGDGAYCYAEGGVGAREGGFI